MSKLLALSARGLIILGGLLPIVVGQSSLGHPESKHPVATEAGTGEFRWTAEGGDGGPATSARLASPKGVALDPINGELFIADTLAPPWTSATDDSQSAARPALVRVVTANRSILKVAGDTFENGGESPLNGGSAEKAVIFALHTVAFDRQGALYIGNNLSIFKIDRGSDNLIRGDDTITWIAGDPFLPNTGPPPEGVPAKSSRLYHVYGMAFDSFGSLFIADGYNDRIRKVIPGSDGVVDGDDDELISTVAGTGESAFTADGVPGTVSAIAIPSGIAFDHVGNLFIADMRNHRIRRLVPGLDGVINGLPDELISTVAGRGKMATINQPGVPGAFGGDHFPSSGSDLNWPRSVTFDGSGNLLIADSLNHRIRRVTPGADGIVTGSDPLEIIDTLAGDGSAVAPTSVQCGDPSFPACSAPGMRPNLPFGLAVPSCLPGDPETDLWVSEWNNNRVRKLVGAAKCGQVDLSISLESDKSEVTAGQTVNLTLTAKNQGLQAAQGVKIDLSGDLSLMKFGNPNMNKPGTCGPVSEAQVVCRLSDELQNGQTVTLSVLGRAIQRGEITTTASVENTTPVELTASRADNSASLLIRIVAPQELGDEPAPGPSSPPVQIGLQSNTPSPRVIVDSALPATAGADPTQSGLTISPPGTPSVPGPSAVPSYQSLLQHLPLTGALGGQAATQGGSDFNLVPMDALVAAQTAASAHHEPEPADRYAMVVAIGLFLGGAAALGLAGRGCLMLAAKPTTGPAPALASTGPFAPLSKVKTASTG